MGRKLRRKSCCQCVKMSKVQKLRSLVNQRLTAAVEEIFGLFERTIAEYEEEVSRSKQENERQRKLLDAVFNPEVRLHRTGGSHSAYFHVAHAHAFCCTELVSFHSFILYPLSPVGNYTASSGRLPVSFSLMCVCVCFSAASAAAGE